MPRPSPSFTPLASLLLVGLLAGCSLPSWMGGAAPKIDRLPGERVDALPVADMLKPDAALAATPVALPPVYANSSWSQHSGMLQSARGNLAGGAFTQEESASAGEGNDFEHSLLVRPVVDAGLVFAMDGVGRLSAHDSKTLALRWQSVGVADEDDPPILGGGLAVDGGVLYAASGRGVVSALEAASGKALWRQSLKLPLRSPPRVAGGKLYLITVDSQLYALSASTGDVLWTHRGINESSGIANAVSPALSSNAVIVPYASGELYALSQENGHELWQMSLAAGRQMQADNIFSGIGGDPAVDADVVIAVASGGGLSVFSAQTGQPVWQRPIASVNTPWLAGDYLYVLSSDNTLICFVKYTGQIRWSTRLPSYENEERRLDPIAWRGPVMSDGRLFIAGSRGQMAVVSAADGALEMRDIPGDIYTAPVIADGRLYLMSQEAKLYGFQ